MSTTPQTQVQKADTREKAITFTPFGTTDKIQLSIRIVQNIVAVKTRSGKSCTDQDAMKFMMLCETQKLNPFAGDCFLVGYDKKQFDNTYAPQFSMITAHQSFLKRAEACPDFEGMESGIIILLEDGKLLEREGDFKLPDENVVGGWARVFRKGRKPTVRKLSIASMKPNYDTPFWNEDKAPGQIVKCSEADALRSTFPTLLGGLYTHGEFIDIHAERMPTSSETAPDKMIELGSLTSQESGAQSANISKPSEKGTTFSDKTPQSELEQIVTEAGFTFDHLKKWGNETGNVTEADSIPDFASVKTDEAKRIIRSKIGLLKGLEAIKGAA